MSKLLIVSLLAAAGLYACGKSEAPAVDKAAAPAPAAAASAAGSAAATAASNQPAPQVVAPKPPPPPGGGQSAPELSAADIARIQAMMAKQKADATAPLKK